MSNEQTSKPIRLTELVKQDDDLKEQPCVVDAGRIVSLHTGTLNKSGPVLVGDGSFERTVTRISTSTGGQIFVTQTPEEIVVLWLAAL